MKTPSIHLNGTDHRELLRQAERAGVALQEALEALAGMAPNARDYYTQEPVAFNAALVEHQERVTRVRSVYDEVAEIFVAIEDAVAARRPPHGGCMPDQPGLEGDRLDGETTEQYQKRTSPLINAAAQATETIDADELERAAEDRRR